MTTANTMSEWLGNPTPGETIRQLRSENLRLQTENKELHKIVADLVAWGDYRATDKRKPDRDIRGIIERARDLVTK